ncbi:hypothetical protein MBLNU459_g8418t1 [Dothideomycetes sp. NU459]
MRSAPQQMNRDNATSKRKREVDTIDLTQSDDDAPNKVHKNNWPSRPTPSSSDYRTSSHGSPQSSAPQHSQPERDSWLAPHTTQDHEGDIYESIASSQNVAIGSEEFIKYSELPSKIVGVRYYQGFATFGEQVEIIREPGNPYDLNAIRVDNMVGEQIGHIPKTVAAKLAKYIDHGWLAVEGIISGSIGQFDCPIILNLFGPALSSPASREIHDKMKADRLPLQAFNQQEREEKKRLAEQRKMAAKSARAPSSSQPEFMGSQTVGQGEALDPTMDDILEASERFNPRDVGQAAEKFGNAEDVLAAMPQAKQPTRISTPMLPYQLQALQWLQEKENPKVPPVGSTEFVQLWRRHEKVQSAFTNIATSFSIKGQDLVLASGGILADDMGLGKTLEMISLMVSDAENSKRRHSVEAMSTLIIAPLSVMSNWSDQIARHVRKDQPLRVYIYHGTGRKQMKPAEFEENDVCITTYQTLASDYMPHKSSKAAPVPRPTGLYSVKWRRIILDEGHTIRNPQSKGAAAVNAVLAHSRWVLTGTPIINSLKDLYSLIRFIGLTGGLEKLDIFNRVLVRPMKAGDESATFLLQAIMTSLCLRRRKEMKFVDLKLPELSEYVHRIPFADKEKERYEALLKEAQGKLQEYQGAQGQKASDTYRHLLEILLRLRQVCNHWQLCAERISNLLDGLQKQRVISLTPENRKTLQDMLQLSIESHEECPICLEHLHNPVITHCAHIFGEECISRIVDTTHKCPLCRAELKDQTVLVQPAHEYGDESKDDELDVKSSSTKLEALISILNASKDSGNKTIIFSQWTRFLDVVQARLDREGYRYCRIDGTMSAPLRDQALRQLETDEGCTIMLASLGVCAVGLNLVAANQIILSDTWWAPAIEDQAVDRVHRLGQKKKTTVFRLVMEESIEERTLDIQAEKRKLMMVAFQEKSSKRGGDKSARLGDIKKLLG